MTDDPGPAHSTGTPPGGYRLADVPVDDAWVRTHNESYAEVRRLQISAGILAAILVGVGAACVLLSGGALWSLILAVPLGLLALGCLAMIVYIPRSAGSMQHTYGTSELIPAMIAEVRPRGVTLLALVERAVDRTAGSRPTLVARPCEKLPGHGIRVGERVPCVAVVGNRRAPGRDATWQHISPMPVAWANGDTGVVRRCAAEIPEGTWDTLRRSLDRLEEVRSSTDGMLPLT